MSTKSVILKHCCCYQLVGTTQELVPIWPHQKFVNSRLLANPLIFSIMPTIRVSSISNHIIFYQYHYILSIMDFPPPNFFNKLIRVKATYIADAMDSRLKKASDSYFQSWCNQILWTVYGTTQVNYNISCGVLFKLFAPLTSASIIIVIIYSISTKPIIGLEAWVPFCFILICYGLFMVGIVLKIILVLNTMKGYILVLENNAWMTSSLSMDD